MEVLRVTAHAGADLQFVRFVGRAGEGIEAVSGEEPHESRRRDAARLRGKFKMKGGAGALQVTVMEVFPVRGMI